jgi:SAM-dependent methyltransferase
VHTTSLTAQSYDEIPYDSVPICETHPGNLAVLGALFGLNPARPESCRVLELGCASGGNLIPMAYHLPGAEFLGIDLSAGQVAGGRALVEALGLRNIRIEQGDILDLGDIGQFDYVIAHGLYSWVPAAVRERLLELCGQALTPDGIAYVSYNTLPGWRQRSVLRDMLLQFTRDATTPRTRLVRAHEALEQLEAAFAEQDGVVPAQLHADVVKLRTRHPSYLYHEYLTAENTPVLFSEFMAQAGRHGLQYLCESELQTMFSDTLGPAGAALVDRFDSLIEQEQCIDFLRLRAFRQTLLCRADRPTQRELELEHFAQLAYHAFLTPPHNPGAGAPQVFTSPDGATRTVQHPLTQAALRVLAEAYPDALGYDEIERAAQERVSRDAPAVAAETDHLFGELVTLALHQFVGMSAQPRRFQRQLAQRPCASRLARAQAGAGLGHVSTIWHMPMGLDDFAQRFINYLDGTHTLSMLTERMLDDIVDGQLALAQPITDRSALAVQVEENCRRLLGTLQRHGILQPET